ncbi:MAG: 3-dehydroquinate synthase [Bacteroidetes bacterium]|nr:3-dehydroquinate synthase [Bacteroidota bacterium]
MIQSNGFDSIHFLDSISDITSFVQKQASSQIVFLCDSNTYLHCYLPYFKELNHPVITIPNGDNHKNFEQFVYISESLLKLHADRDSLIINLGGGMICDLGGFVASVYKRGIRFINIPTTTLAMADAAYGGKTAINLGLVKNLLGTFQNAESICIATEFIKTLPKREQISGLAEIVKMMLLFDSDNWLEIALHPTLPDAKSPELMRYIHSSLKAKDQVVSKDPNESGIRKSLNYGHSIGHAIEAVYNAEADILLHGEAIFWGMQLENLIAEHIGMMDKEDRIKINKILSQFHPLPNKIKDIDIVLESLHNDKKNKEGKFIMTLLKKPQEFILNAEVSFEVVSYILKNYHNL